MWRVTIIIQSEWKKGEAISQNWENRTNGSKCHRHYATSAGGWWNQSDCVTWTNVIHLFRQKYLLWITVYLYNFPEIKWSPSFQSGVRFHRHTPFEWLPYAVGLQVGRGNHQQKHKTEWIETYRIRFFFFYCLERSDCDEWEWSAVPHNERNYDVELDFPVGPRQALCTGS